MAGVGVAGVELQGWEPCWLERGVVGVEGVDAWGGVPRCDDIVCASVRPLVGTSVDKEPMQTMLRRSGGNHGHTCGFKKYTYIINTLLL